MKKLSIILLATLLAFSIFGCSNTHSSQHTLKFGVIPYENVQAITDDYGPLASYMGKQCGTTGEVFVTPEYSGVLTALRADQIDCAFLNPLSYVLAVQEFKGTPEHLIPLAMPDFNGSPTYRGIIFTRVDSGIHNLKDFKGKTFAFGDETSTSGYLYPADMLQKAGVDPNKDLKPVNVTGGGVLAVLSGQAAGGATFDGDIALQLKDPAEQKELKVIAYTTPIPNGMIVARGNLDPKTLATLKEAIDSANTDPVGKAALAKIPWNKLIPPDDSMFDSVRQKARIFGLNLQSLDAKKK